MASIISSGSRGLGAARYFSVVAAFVIVLLPSVARADPLRLLVFGDSLSSGFLLSDGAGFADALARRLYASGHGDVMVIKDSVPGDTTTNALQRLPSALGQGPDLVIVELGGNDMLDATDPRVVFRNLDTIISLTKAAGARVILAGMLAHPSLGPVYKARFDAIYPTLAASHKVPLYPFFLRGVFGDPRLMLPDGKHPNAFGVQRIVAGILPIVERSLADGRRQASTVRTGRSANSNH